MARLIRSFVGESMFQVIPTYFSTNQIRRGIIARYAILAMTPFGSIGPKNNNPTKVIHVIRFLFVSSKPFLYLRCFSMAIRIT
jgi:hypothetical protein